MLLHIGEGTLVRARNVIGFFDLDGTSGDVTKGFLHIKEKDGVTEMLTTDIPRSFVVTDEKVYITRLSTSALRGRGEKENSECRMKNAE
ncbi:MAG: DUF370 domain-containing protein [Clostridia bacterium]|nr:DUF370 domain-containing protein [Clostridia bacterium]